MTSRLHDQIPRFCVRLLGILLATFTPATSTSGTPIGGMALGFLRSLFLPLAVSLKVGGTATEVA